MKKLLTAVTVFALIMVNSAQAQRGGGQQGQGPQDLPRLAVVEFSVNLTTEKVRADAITVRNLTESRMVAAGKYQVIAREEIDKLLANQRIQVSSISSAENVKKLQLENISYIVTGSVDAMGSDYAVTVKILDVSTGKFSHSASDIMGGASRELFAGVTALIANFVKGMAADGGQVAQAGAQRPGGGVSAAGIGIEVSAVVGGTLYFEGKEIAALWDNDTYMIPVEKPGTYKIRMVFGNGQEISRNVTITSRGVVKEMFAPPPRSSMSADLAEVFGVRGIKALLDAIHEFLQTCNSGGAGGRRAQIARRIMLGDWIDLPHLTVQGDAGGGAIDTDNVDLGGKGKLLRLIVVGIDSFAGTNKDAPAHIVFQFQNIPGTHRMNPTNTNAGGYKASEMRQYLTGSFLRGLIAAGVPEGALYAPTRYIANGGGGASAADAPADRLWLPTEREMFGGNEASNTTWETAANQARLEYYESNSRRIKYDREGDRMWWWEASPSAYSGSAAYFCHVHYYGLAYNYLASSVGGCAPAFCVR
ncbi:MAG: DUF6273 domain-containing protein [Treponema sp.]|nr:DUF6273 domain-containing protein [Treponema sp.]